MDPMKRFVDERKKTVEAETAKLRQEYEAIIAYVGAVMQKADAGCQELRDESNCECFRKKCVPFLNWIQEKYDSFLLMRSLCLQSSESEVGETESCQNSPLADGNAEKPRQTPEDKNEISACRNVPNLLTVPLTCEPPLMNAASVTPDIHAESLSRGYCSSMSESSLTEPLMKSNICSAIPKCQIKELTMKVLPTCITSPWLFWVQLESRGCGLEDLLEGLTNYNKKLKQGDPNYKFTSKPHAGQIVAAQYTDDSMWYRAVVLAVFEIPVKSGKKKIEVDVGYVDYGNSERLPLSHVRPIPERFTKLPFHAFVCSLTQVAPIKLHGTLSWPKDVLESFCQLDCANTMTVRFSKPVPNCPLMFIDILNCQPSDPPVKVITSRRPTFTETMIADKQAVYMPDNGHVVKWYWETYSHITQAAGPGEKMISSLTQQDLHSALMPILDMNMFENSIMQKSSDEFSLPDADRNVALCSELPREQQLPCANKTEPSMLKTVQDRPSYADQVPSMVSLMNQASQLHSNVQRFEKLDSKKISGTVSQSSYHVTQSSVEYGVSGLMDRTLTSNKPTTGNEGLNNPNLMTGAPVCNQFDRFSSSLSAKNASVGILDYRPVTPCGASEFVATKDVLGKTSMKSENTFSVVDAAVFMSHQLPNESTCTFSQANVDIARKSNAESSCPIDHPMQSSANMNRISESNAIEILPDHVATISSRASLKVKGEKDKLHSSEPPASPHSLLKQKLLETEAYVNRLAESGWPERIAQAALLQADDSLQSVDCFASSWPQSTSRLQTENEQLSNGHHAHIVARGAPQTAICGYDDCRKICSATSCMTKNPIKVPDAKFSADNIQSDHRDLEMNSVFSDYVVNGASKCISEVPLKCSVLEHNRDNLKPKVTGRQVTGTVSQLIVPAERFIRVAMSFVKSPSRFWIHRADTDARTIDYVESEIEKCFATDAKSSDDSALKLLLTDPVIRDYGLCCARSRIDDKIYRAELVDAYVEPADHGSASNVKLEVFYIDFGNTEWITLERFFSMPRHLTTVPPLAICCMLDGVEPVVSSNGFDNWSRDAVEVFTDMCGFTKMLVGKFPAGVEAGDILYHSRDHPLRLQLVDSNSDQPIEISEQLITLGFARASAKNLETHMRTKCNEDETDEMENWAPMAEDFLSYRNSYMVDVDDPGVATVNYKAQDERRICRFYNSKKSRCWRGDDCPFEHVVYEGVVTTTDRRVVFGVCDDELQLELPPVDGWVVVSITCVISPSQFFVVLPFGNKSISDMVTDVKKPAPSSQHDGCDDQASSPLSERKYSLGYLMDSLQECYKSKVYIDNDLIVYSEGEIVAVRFTQDERWHRAKIIACEPDNNTVQVLYVDYGNKEWVTHERIRQIEIEFLYLPFQAVECRLPLCANNRYGEPWSDRAKQFFITSTKGKYLIAHVLQRTQGGGLYVDLYDTNGKEVNINKSLLEKGHARKTDRLPEFQYLHPKPSDREINSPGKNQFSLIPG